MATTTIFLESGTDATQDLTFYNLTTGTLTSATDQVYSGLRSLKCSSTAGNAAATATQANNITFSNAGSQMSVWTLFDAIPAALTQVFAVQGSGASVRVQVGLNTDGRLAIFGNGMTQANGTTVLSINTWYRFCLSFYITDSTHFQFKLYCNGTLEATANAGTLTNIGAGSRAVYGFNAGTYGANQNMWFDNIYVSTGGASSVSQPDTGNIIVAAKRPNANGTTNSFNVQIGSGGSGYGTGHSSQVNEQPLNVANGWSVVAAGATTEEYNVEDAATGGQAVIGTIVDVGGWLYAKALNAETGSMVLNGATSNISLTTINTLFKAYAGSTAYPAGTGTDIGIVTSALATTVSLFECGILVAFIPPPEPTIRFLGVLGVGR